MDTTTSTSTRQSELPARGGRAGSDDVLGLPQA